MDHDELVRKYSTPWEQRSPESQERIRAANERIDRLRAEGKIIPESLQERHDQFIPGLNDNMEPLHPTRSDGAEQDESGEQDRNA